MKKTVLAETDRKVFGRNEVFTAHFERLAAYKC